MSGGHFGYNQFRIDEIADGIELAIRENDTEDEWGYTTRYQKHILDKFQDAADLLRKCSMMVHEID